MFGLNRCIVKTILVGEMWIKLHISFDISSALPLHTKDCSIKEKIQQENDVNLFLEGEWLIYLEDNILKSQQKSLEWVWHVKVSDLQTIFHIIGILILENGNCVLQIQYCIHDLQ